jgi:hypothetical protein
MMITILALATTFAQSAVKVELVNTAGKWQMMRGGKPYYVKGVGGTGRMDDLVKAGGNSMRTWGTERAAKELDDCQAKGLSLMVGIWLGHKSYFDYSNPAKCAEQREMVKRDVLKFRNHPALLIWGLGNEMELDGNDNPTLWKEINELAKITKANDPNHPAATVIADISPEKIAMIMKYAPEIDLLGINSYGGLKDLPQRLRAAGWKKPYVVTEFGPNGPWEMKKTAWNAALEPTSTEKATKYASDYKNSIAGQPDICLGSFAFLWGDKQEETPTWFGMFLPSGERTEAADVMQLAWTGKPAPNRCPQIISFEFNHAQREVGSGASLLAKVSATDPDRDRIQYKWEVRNEAVDKAFDGNNEKRPAPLTGPWSKVFTNTLKVSGPPEKGNYRLYVYALDGKGNAAVGNFPFKVQ